MPLTIVIGTKRYSSWSLRAWMAASAACAGLREISISLRQPETKAEILKWSPSGKVPLLIDGDLRIWDSLAICEYLAERFPNARLWPEQMAARALARSVSAEMHAGFAALRQSCSMDVLEDLPMADISAELRADMERIDAIWRDCRERFGAGGPYLFGHFTIADAMYAPVATRIRTYHLPVSAEAQAYCGAILSHPAMLRWIEGAREQSRTAEKQHPVIAADGMRIPDLGRAFGLHLASATC
ncbi:MAG: glutathione S-transferase family protein [Magnetospirillum sp.]|nr:glutathione S-transferase family protein [Magnetospirillum sp.]